MAEQLNRSGWCNIAGANRTTAHDLLALLFKLLTFFACVPVAFAQSTIRVPLNFPTIQAAINAAVAGDTVLVAPGVYTENINFNGKAITVSGESGANFTVIDGNGAGPVVSFTNGEGQSSRLVGFTIRNGGAPGSGGGMNIYSSSPVVTDNIIIHNRVYGYCSPGIYVSTGSPLIQRNLIGGNSQPSCGSSGGGIYIIGNSSAQIVDNIIVGNSGSGISLFAAGTPVIRGNIIAGNEGAQGGGMWIVNQSDALIVQNLFFGNTASSGGGIYWLVPQGAQGPLLVNNTLVDNDSISGSAIFADGFDAQVRLYNNLIVAKDGQTALHCGGIIDNTIPIVQFNNIHASSGTAAGGLCANVTGAGGNISANPLFADPALRNYRPTLGSPAIDAGSNTVPGLPSLDLDGNARIRDGDGNGQASVDMGAYEFISAPRHLTLSPASGDLGTFIAGVPQPDSRVVTISNDGLVSMPVNLSAVVSNDSAAFMLTPGGPAPCSSLTPTLAAGTNCTMVLTFTPTSLGAKKATLVVMPDTVGSSAFATFSATVRLVDTSPDFFGFQPSFLSGVPRNSAIFSNSVVITGIEVPVPIAITGGEYSIDGGAFTASPGTIQNGQSVVVKVMSSPNYYAFSTATLMVGDGSTNFGVETLGPTFIFANGTSRNPSPSVIKTVVPGSVVVSETITVSGTDGPFPISISGGEYSIDGAPFTTTPGTIQNNQSVVVRQTAPTTFNTTTVATLVIASQFGSFSVRTPNQTAPPTTNYFPLAVGHSWTFRRNGVVGPASTITDAQIINDVLVFGVPDAIDGITYYSNDGVNGVGLHRAILPPSFIEGCGTVAEIQTYSPPITIIPANVLVGQTVSSSGTVSAAAGTCGTVNASYAASSALETIERVSVPAGQFDALRVRFTLSYPVLNVTSTAVVWLAPGVGQVRAQYDDGSVEELVSTNVGMPGAPTAIFARAGYNSVTVTFAPPANDGGSAITGYTATCISNNGGAPGSNTVGATATSVQISGLTNGKNYTCSVVATNAAGAGIASLLSNAIVPIDISFILNLLLMDDTE